MKKSFLLLAVAMCTVSLNAQMQVWSAGQMHLEMDLQDIDSITFLRENTAEEVKDLTYDNWRGVTHTRYYSHKDAGKWESLALPWAKRANTTIAKEYRHPEQDTVWQLAFNLLPDSTIGSVYMFGLWNAKRSVMRIYSYIEELPNQFANYCYYKVTSEDQNVFVERDAMTWMPSDSTINRHWNASAIANSAAQTSKTSTIIMPITGTDSAQINTGWICMELNFSSGITPTSLDNAIQLSLIAQENIHFSGSGKIHGWMAGHNGKIVVPGNKTKSDAGISSAVGRGASGIASAAASGVTVGVGLSGTSGKILGAITAIVGMIGSVMSTAGDAVIAAEEAKDDTLKMNMDFSISDTLEFGGTLSSTVGSQGGSITMTYGDFIEGINNHSTKAPKKMKSGANDSITFGAWNLAKQPVLYVGENMRYITKERNKYDILISFLDPSSIDLELNLDNVLFDVTDLDSISLVAYDYAFVGRGYNVPALPYYDYYGIRHDKPTMGLLALECEDFANGVLPCSDDSLRRMYLLDPEAVDSLKEMYDMQIGTYAKNDRLYSGIELLFESGTGMDAYNMVYSPAVLMPTGRTGELTEISVAVILELKFKDGTSRIFAERFLPEVRTFKLSDVADLKTHFQNISEPQTYKGIPLQMLLYDKQKAKALRLLEPLTYFE